ncbi:hypothetical protein ABZ714_19460 [Streptomyces sp. NPDC006798]|uniref:hypothetical protein n=1 Tax=Streptomyces sp. NPDC006798 TaxID=3155462 RepID=UPI0033E54A74
MALLTRAEIDAADDRAWEDVPVPEWGGDVRVQGMSGSERNAYQSSLVVMGSGGSVQRLNMADQTAKLLAKCLVDAEGERLYSDKEVKALGAKNGAVLERLSKVAARLSGLRKEDMAEAEGKSEDEPTGASTTG